MTTDTPTTGRALLDEWHAAIEDLDLDTRRGANNLLLGHLFVLAAPDAPGVRRAMQDVLRSCS